MSSAKRIRSLERWDSLSAIVEAILSTNSKIALRRPESRDGYPSITRFTFALQGLPAAVDAFFNGPCGYRAAHLSCDAEQSPCIDRMVVGAIIDRHYPTLTRTPAALKSFQSPQAKVWIKQDARVTSALHGLLAPTIEIAIEAWESRQGVSVETPKGPRYLARAGVLATSGNGVLEVIGGWIKDCEPWIDSYKTSSRSQQIRDYGFT